MLNTSMRETVRKDMLRDVEDRMKKKRLRVPERKNRENRNMLVIYYQVQIILKLSCLKQQIVFSHSLRESGNWKQLI